MTKRPDTGHVFYRNLNKTYPAAEKGEGIYIRDSSGRRYIDGSGGAVVASIGHGVPEIRDAALAQMDRIAFVHGSQFTNRAAEELAARLASMAPPGLERVYFVSGGSEAVETAVKMARQYQVDRGQPSRYKVLSRWTSYHGNTLGALAWSGHTGRRRYYQPLIRHTPHIAHCYCFRCPFDRVPETCRLECAGDLEKTILFEGPDSVCAFLAEPVVGATAGVLVPPDGYLRRIREICDRYDILLITDEVMTGMGRTGKNFCADHWGVVPDLVACAKGLSGGYAPLACVIAKEEIHETIREKNGAFVHGHTYAQNPLSCAIGLAVVDYIERHGLIGRSRQMGGYLLDRLCQRLSELHVVGDVRGLGLLAGVEFVADKTYKTPFDPSLRAGAKIAARAFEKGLIVYPGAGGADGVAGDHVLVAPPFVISTQQIDELVEILGQSVEEFMAAL